MRRHVTTLIILALSLPLSAEGLADYLPSSQARKAASLVAAIDTSSEAIRASRAGLRELESRAQADALDAYVIMAASASGEFWVRSDGSSIGPQAFAEARKRSRETALSLASGQGEEEAKRDRDSAILALATLIKGSGIGAHDAQGLDDFLLKKAKEPLRLFPEIGEVDSHLRRSGATGAREAAAAMARRSADGIAQSLIESRARILVLAPEAEGALSRLDSSYTSYRSWIAASPYAAYPSDVEAAAEREVLAAGIASLASLKQERAVSLIAAMEKRDGRDSCAAAAARRLAAVWERSSSSRRRSLAALCGCPESCLAIFASAAYLRDEASAEPRPNEGRSLSESIATRERAIAAAADLNGLAIAIADDEAGAGKGSRAREPALILLERPELWSLARAEPRYASLYDESMRRLAALQARASEEAAASLEGSAALAWAAERALGAKGSGGGVASLVVRAVELGQQSVSSGRRLAFFASAQDSAGMERCLPIPAESAASAYAAALASAAGIERGSAPASAFLGRFGQTVVCAYDPEHSGAALAIGSSPSSTAIRVIGAVDLELALVGGWKQ